MCSSKDTQLAKPILITGIGGFIGSQLAERLLHEGFSIRGLVRRAEEKSSLIAQGVDVIVGDLLDAESLSKAMAGCYTVVHAAAWTVAQKSVSNDMAWRTNVEGTINLLAGARAAGVERFLHVSSISIYGLSNGPLIDEDTVALPVGHPYPDSKIAAEVAVKASGLPFVIIRPAHVYGPQDAWSKIILEQIKQNRISFYKKDHGLITPIYIDDLIDAILLILRKKDVVNQVFNICDKEPLTYREFYQSYANMLKSTKLHFIPSWRAKLASVGFLRELLGKPSPDQWSFHVRFHPLHYSIERARSLLGYSPKVTFNEGIRRTEEWLRTEGYLS